VNTTAVGVATKVLLFGTPLPLSDTLCGLVVASDVIVSVPFRVPVAVGANTK
jgi:hypothetical protein